jgi:hypothetical protein
VTPGSPVDLRLSFAPAFPRERAAPVGDGVSLNDTIAGWTSWAGLHHGYDGRHAQAVRRSSLVLQGLTYGPTGAVVAAATTSLPETMGGGLNFDYRYAWLRDLSLTIRSLWIAACPDEANRFLAWISQAAGQIGSHERVQIMYGVEGERHLAEHELDHLAGFRGSRPVRVGNAAWDQEQLDVLGEVLDAAHQLRDQLGDLKAPTRSLLVAPRRPRRLDVAIPGRRDVGGAGRAPPVRLLESHVLGGARSRDLARAPARRRRPRRRVERPARRGP